MQNLNLSIPKFHNEMKESLKNKKNHYIAIQLSGKSSKLWAQKKTKLAKTVI